MLTNPHLIDRALANHPDIVIVVFGANSISTDVHKKDVLENCRNFYELLHSKLMHQNSNAKIIATECPMRFVYDHDHNTPIPDDFRKFRKSLNSKIEGLKCKNYLLRLSGADRLELEKRYRDGVHFDEIGVQIFFENIIKCLQYVLDKQNLSYQTQLSYRYYN